MKLRFADRAKLENASAFAWYQQQSKRTGLKFIDHVDAAINLIVENPEMCRIHYGNFRIYVIQHFPYSIIYTVDGTEILIHSIFANRQDPRKRP